MTPQDVPSNPVPPPYRPVEKRDPNQPPARGTRGVGYDELAGAPPAVWKGAAPADAPPAPPPAKAPAKVPAKTAAADAPGSAVAPSPRPTSPKPVAGTTAIPSGTTPTLSGAVGATPAKSIPKIPAPPVPTEFPPEALKAQCEQIVARYPVRLAALLPILHLAQRNLGGFISPELEAGIAQYLGCSDQHVRGVLTFYTMFNTKPVGRHHVQVCRTLSCWLRGAGELTACLKRTTGLSPGETDAERKFTVSEVECLGLCEVAPALFVNDDAHVNVTTASLEKLVKSLS